MRLKPPYEVEHDEDNTYVALPGKDYAVAKALGQDADARKEHAAFIVKACNSHDELVAQLKDVRDRIKESEFWWMDSPNKGGFDLEAIEAVLAKLEAS